MKIYNYDEVNKEFIGESAANKSPLEKNVYLIPANATKLKPPTAVNENELVVFVDTKWEIVPDFRGHTYWLEDGEEVIIDKIGIEIPEDALLKKPIPRLEPETVLAPPTKEELIVLIKREASRRILKICPEWKQTNLLAQAVILNDKGRNTWTKKELTSWDSAMALWDRISDIRLASKVLELSPDINYKNDSNWP